MENKKRDSAHRPLLERMDKEETEETEEVVLPAAVVSPQSYSYSLFPSFCMRCSSSTGDSATRASSFFLPGAGLVGPFAATGTLWLRLEDCA